MPFQADLASNRSKMSFYDPSTEGWRTFSRMCQYHDRICTGSFNTGHLHAVPTRNFFGKCQKLHKRVDRPSKGDRESASSLVCGTAKPERNSFTHTAPTARSLPVVVPSRPNRTNGAVTATAAGVDHHERPPWSTNCHSANGESYEPRLGALGQEALPELYQRLCKESTV
jgi:hypothetical protein